MRSHPEDPGSRCATTCRLRRSSWSHNTTCRCFPSRASCSVKPPEPGWIPLRVPRQIIPKSPSCTNKVQPLDASVTTASRKNLASLESP